MITIEKLPTNFIDAETEDERYRMKDTDDGQTLVEDVSEYTEFGSYYGAREINAQHEAINDLIDNQNEVQTALDKVMDGTTIIDTVDHATSVTRANTADYADNADTADTADYANAVQTADLADYAPIADLADLVDYAQNATSADTVEYATSAGTVETANTAISASRVDHATTADRVAYIESVPTATSATSANSAAYADKISGATINGVSFNGTKDITIYDNTKLPLNQSFILCGKEELEFTNSVCTIEDSRITANSLAIVNFTPDCLGEAKQATISVETSSGAVTLTAGRTPAKTLYATIHIRVV